MASQCQICRQAAERTQLVVYTKERNSKPGYLVMDDRVVFESAKILKFLYFCETQGLHPKNNDILDICENCLRSARIEMN